jgi:2-oxoglutarate dehydrogenase E1 component
VQDVQSALTILIHGDAAFPSEGIVAETLNLSRLRGYTCGGTIHIITNNQLGFTTEPGDARSTLYASDLAKGFEIPIVHVNADDPEACLAAATLASAYRERFHKDFLIDLVGYRRWGHNEGDEPAFTQPVMYELVRQHPTARELWARMLDREGSVPMAESVALAQSAFRRLQELYSDVDHEPVQSEPEHLVDQPLATGVAAETLAACNAALVTLPAGFHLHPKLDRLIQARRSALAPGGAIDWAHAEALAFASLLAEGTPIRLAGQDVERGTFSQRHLVLHDAVTGAPFLPLHALQEARASFAIYNSPLSESGALGFEYGYSSEASNALVVWEAQYGDFANAGQVIIDQFIAAARAKWQQFPWLVLLLPHGYEGQGPEHSSGRLERYLQLAGENNLRIANCTTAAQYFHLLRRQVAVHKEDAQPLILMTPKSLLRHPMAASPVEELVTGRFHPVIDDPEAAARRDGVTRLVLCTGKVYVDVVSSPARRETNRVAVARVEQLYPFPASELGALLDAYPNLREVVWLQEEPRNMGAWRYMAYHLRDLIGRVPRIDYIGRPDRASPAEGSVLLHQREQARIVAEAFSGLQGPASPIQGVKHYAE